MGTNYYLEKKPTNMCEHCGRGDEMERLHIGKSSMGWCFGLHVIPEEGIHDLHDWKKIWSDGKIVNEYGEVCSPGEMEIRITEREGSNDWDDVGYVAKGIRGYKDWKEFHTVNHSEPGPKGLLRHTIGDHCLNHGEGTWDCIPGWFS